MNDARTGETAGENVSLSLCSALPPGTTEAAAEEEDGAGDPCTLLAVDEGTTMLLVGVELLLELPCARGVFVVALVVG